MRLYATTSDLSGLVDCVGSFKCFCMNSVYFYPQSVQIVGVSRLKQTKGSMWFAINPKKRSFCLSSSCLSVLYTGSVAVFGLACSQNTKPRWKPESGAGRCTLELEGLLFSLGRSSDLHSLPFACSPSLLFLWIPVFSPCHLLFDSFSLDPNA